MLNRSKAMNQYANIASVDENSSPHRLVQMLMEGVLDKLAAAKGSIERNDYSAKSAQISTAMSIINALKGSLDMSAGGEIAANLHDLYVYMNTKLLDANALNNIDYIDEVVSLVREIKTAWDAMPEDVKRISRQENSVQNPSATLAR